MVEDGPDETQVKPRGRKRRVARRGLLAFSLVLGMAVLLAWFQRREIADDLIADVFRERGIPARYTIESIGTRRQVITGIVIGDPARPDLTIDRMVVRINPRLGLPEVTGIEMGQARLYGSYRNGKLSLGSLDPLLFTGSEEPFRLPDLNVSVADGRALMVTEYGRIGVKLAGKGALRGGFTGEVAAISRDLSAGDCSAANTTLYGTLAIEDEAPRFTGPLRFDRLACPGSDLAVAQGSVQLDVGADKALAAAEGEAQLRLADASMAENRAGALEGGGEFSWRDGGLTSAFELALRDVSTPQAMVAALELDGDFRAREDFARMELASSVDGTGVRLGQGLERSLAGLADSTDGTLLQPLLARAREGLAAESRRSALAGNFILRSNADGLTAVVPDMTLRGSSGATLVALSRGALRMGEAGAPVFSGNFATAGEGLPQIAGRMEQDAPGGLTMRLRMSEYAAGDARLEVPEMVLIQRPDGALSMEGGIRASGALPGGSARNLELPVSGTYSPGGQLAMWSGCTRARFDSLEVSNLTFGRQELLLCPPRGSSILRYGPGGLRLAAGTPSLQLQGRLGETPIAISSGPVGMAYPGAVSAKALNITLGPSGTATRFAITDLRADFGKDIAGEFAGSDVFLDAVPLDLLGASGSWRYAGGRLSISDASFTLQDRQEAARFEPLQAQGATLSLEDNLILADIALTEPKTGQEVTQVAVRHDLATGAGGADLMVAGIDFTQGGLQPLDLSDLALGVVANVEGRVTGEGQIAWNADEVTSTGQFSSDSLDFAAAFGPVKGASGTVVFTDLLGLTTAPNQRLKVASINPGIEVFDGEVGLSLVNGKILRFEGGTWPFLGGTLRMQPVDLNIGMSEVRRYVIEIEGLDAAKFIERLEIGNLQAEGIFDGTIPIVFDEDGNGELANGVLVSRPPGGHLSYVGQLTYEDLSFVGNLAFQTLRDLKYRRMEIVMNGPLTGELVTRVRFDGIEQGDTAQKNIISRTIARIPIQLNVNIRAPFYALLSSTKSLYDPSAVRDPRSLGLIDADGDLLREEIDQQEVEARDKAAAESAAQSGNEDTGDIQTSESESLP